MGTLYLVATPIGNLEDISARALRLLSQASLIAAEDTRQTRKLLSHFNIQTPLTSYHEFNKVGKLTHILAALNQGDVALVSDAGTPGLNDPGYELVRAALSAGYPVSPIPGPAAPVSALVASGLPTDAFLYLGYLPRKAAERRRMLGEVAGLPYTLIFLEAPHRVLDALRDLQTVLGDRPAAVARELTKLHEEIFRGSLAEALAHFTDQAPRGEFTLVVGGKPQIAESWSEERLRAALKEALASGEPPSQAAARIAAMAGWPRREVYRMATGSDDNG
ncbi:MAG TPA: 16S rRNA (cytidine(1402)-2'-O)-methyltransferase [Anaerolineales bacterium]